MCISLEQGARRVAGLPSPMLLNVMAAILVVGPAARTRGQTVRSVAYHGIRPTGPGGCVALRDPDRAW